MNKIERHLPDWIKIDFRHNRDVLEIKKELRSKHLHTVCEEARCPNLSECFGIKKTATFMILGDRCSRNCRFCNIRHEKPVEVDNGEPENIALMVKELGLRHVVITSVTRDDLPDGGSEHFVKTIQAVKNLTGATVEVLTPDFMGDIAARKRVSDARPEIFNHNVETVKELYSTVRPEGNYMRSVDFLKGIKKDSKNVLSKSGIMVGLGETEDQLKKLLGDLAEAEIDIFTCGQYLRPSKFNIEVREYRSEEWFEKLRETALSFGIKYVYSSPFTRSSYNAAEIISMIKRSDRND
ncbi:MAG: lipoyl synthase [Candidatus Delongbacteria bacterium]|jgi:lipoic acid synthetase|nr:lipoyl synthase [Candidatus Delongbacteria bacterium]MDD4205251.1 lipoyl synthase [Candidatus Delongbacteria bacterium]MDY0017964.1 lipoyl synthase [Candidatus Delongbacteria bacterium]